jgi:hypothetical protein
MATEEQEATTAALAEHTAPASVHAHHLPSPTLAPITMAGGIALLCLGVVTSYLISLVGIVIFAWGLVGLIGDLRRDAQNTAATAKEKVVHE